MPLSYQPPSPEEAREWALDYPDQPISSFACRYPGRYSEAADLARQAVEELGPADSVDYPGEVD